jgi:hypothetical protein
VVWTGSDQYGGEQVHLPHTALIEELDSKERSFALTTWARRTGAEALIVEQLLCKALWDRPTTNITDWWVPTEVLGAIQKWVDHFHVPLWSLGSGMSTFRKPKWVPCSIERTYSPKWVPCSIERTYSPPKPLPLQEAPTDPALVRLGDYFEAYKAEWFGDGSKPTDSALLHVSPPPEEKGSKGKGPTGKQSASRKTGRGGGNAPSRTSSRTAVVESDDSDSGDNVPLSQMAAAPKPRPRVLSDANATPLGPDQAKEKKYVEEGIGNPKYRGVKQAALKAQGAHKAEIKVKAKFREICPDLVVEDHDLPSTSTGPGAPVDDDEEMGEPLD